MKVTTTQYDAVINDIADYVVDYEIKSDIAYETARLCLMDSMGCAMLALSFPDCVKLLGPVVPGATLAHGARIPGTCYALEPVQAAFNIGTMVRWLDYNDTWLAAEWGHPSDNLGAILSLADYVSRQREQLGKIGLVMGDVLTAMIKTHEIQGCMALENSFNRHGLDHVALVKLASAAVGTHLLCHPQTSDCKDRIRRCVSQVFVDGQSLRTYRQAPNTGSRKSWAAGDAAARAVQLALWTARGEMGYPQALTTPIWGFYDVLFGGRPFAFQRSYASYVMENVLFKLVYPAEFHAQTAVEAAVKLHPQVGHRLNEIDYIEIATHQSAIRIICKEGPLKNPADRDHCMQYMVAVALMNGDLHAEDYDEPLASDSRIVQLREKMRIVEESQFSKDYLDPDKRSIANQVTIVFKGDQTPLTVSVEYPIGHPKRRQEGIPVLYEKFKKNLAAHFPQAKIDYLAQVMDDEKKLMSMSVSEWMGLWQWP